MRYAITGIVGLALLVAAGVARGQDYAIDSFFDVFADQSMTGGPPYPSSPPIRIASYGGGMYLEDINLFFGPGSDPFDGGVVAEAVDSGGPAGGDPGNRVTLDIRSPDGNFNVDSFFDITYQIEFDGPERAIEKVDLPSGDFAVDSFFDITYQIEFADGTRETRGVHGTFSPGQPGVTATLVSVLPSGNFAVDSFFDITYQIEFEGQVDAELPLLTIDLEGGHTPEPSTLILLATGALGFLAYRWRRRRR